MKNALVLYAFWAVLGAVNTVSAQTVETPGSAISTISGTSNISLLEAEQAAASSALDGADHISEQSFSRAASAEAMVPDIFKPFRESYYKTVEIAHISWPRLVGGTDGRFGGRLALGLNHPQYIIQKQIKQLGVVGSLDLKIDGIIDGIINSARITIIYDFRRSYAGNDTKMNIFVDRISFKMGIPISGW